MLRSMPRKSFVKCCRELSMVMLIRINKKVSMYEQNWSNWTSLVGLFVQLFVHYMCKNKPTIYSCIRVWLYCFVSTQNNTIARVCRNIALASVFRHQVAFLSDCIDRWIIIAIIVILYCRVALKLNVNFGQKFLISLFWAATFHTRYQIHVITIRGQPFAKCEHRRVWLTAKADASKRFELWEYWFQMCSFVKEP